MPSLVALASRIRRNRTTWVTIADLFAILTAFVLPWSTSLVAIFALCWLGAAAITLDYRIYLALLMRPICALPVALFALAAVGTLWSDAPWAARLYAVGPAVKLLALPGLFYHFQRSTRGMQVLTAFFVSCVLLMVMSWIVAFYPNLALKSGGEYGIPVKNYIDQSQSFALCAVALAYPIVSLLRTKRILPALLLIAVALSFIANMTFVTVSRTALVTMPIMFAVFAILHLKWRDVMIALCATCVVASISWLVSPNLQKRTETFFSDYRHYMDSNEPTSLGLRLEFWRKSLGFFVEAPILGHGTGSTRELFVHAAAGQAGAGAEVIGNPHNQTLNVAVQWGAIGIGVLYAMWLYHLMLFRGNGFGLWIGLLIVSQNIISSLFNSHLFDFHEGWMYVLGVGVAGGMALKARSGGAAVPASSVKP